MPTQRILVMGLPGAGKTFLARELERLLELQGHSVTWFNADEVRRQFDDWDFTPAGRIRQSRRMRELSDASTSDASKSCDCYLDCHKDFLSKK